MPSVDNRAVAIKFDNDDFQRKIGPTLTGLDNLKKGLDLGGAAKGLDGLSDAGKRFNLDGIASAVESINSKFSAMGALAFSIIDNIVTRAISAGARLASGFSLSPIVDGFKEFETNANSIQTILANTADKGTTLDDVTKSLDNLNNYADKTIYNFGQMARNIGTFTAAGVNLQDSTDAIKGISNLAAMSGSNAEQASGVMYQLSQAMSAGKVAAQDWISVTNAGIGGPLKKQLFEAAVALKKLNGVPMGQTFDEWEKGGGNFKKSMEEGVFTSDVLKLALKAMSNEMTESQLIAAGYSQDQATRVLKTAKIAEDAATEVKTFTQLLGTVKEAVGTGWAESFKLLIGNFTEAKELFTGLNNIISGIVQKSAQNRNDMLTAFRDSGGREAAIQGLRDILTSLLLVIGAIKQAWRDIFPQKTGVELGQIVKNLESFLSSLIPTGEQLEKLREIFKVFFGILSSGWTIIKTITIGFITIASAIKNFFGALNFPEQVLGKFLELVGGLSKGSETLHDAVKNGNWGQILNEKLQHLAEIINKINITPQLEKIAEAFQKVKDFFSNLFGQGGTAVAQSQMAALGEASNRLRERWDQLVSIGEKFQIFWEKFKIELAKLRVVAEQIFDKIKESIKNADFSGVWDAVNVGLVAGFLVMMRKLLKDGIKFDFGGGLIEKIAGTFDQLTGTLKTMQQQVKAEIIQKIAIALGILTAAVFVLSLIDSGALTKAMAALAVGMGELAGSLVVLNKVIATPKDAAKLVALTTTLTIFAAALVIFAVAIKILASMSPAELARSLTAVAALLIELGLALKFMPNDLLLVGTAAGIFALGLALISMSIAVKILSTLSWEEMVRGLTGVAALLATLAITMTFMPADLPLIGAGLLLVAASLVVMSLAVKVLGDMDIESMLKGLLGIAALLTILAITLNVLDGALPGAAAVVVAAGALVILALALKVFASMDAGNLIKSLIAVAALLTILAIAMAAMEEGLPGALAMIVAGGAMVVMAIGLKMLGDLSWQQILTGLVALAAVLVVLGVASVALGSALPFMLGLGVALISIGLGFALFGAAILGVGAGVYLLVEAIKTLIQIGPEGLLKVLALIPQFVEGLVIALGTFVVKLLEQIPPILEALGKILSTILQFLIDHMPQIATFITALIQGIIQILRDNVPGLIQVGLELLVALLTGIQNNIYQITTLVANIIIEFLNALNAKMPTIIDAGTQLLVTLLNGLANNLPKVFDAATHLIDEFLRGLGSIDVKIIEGGANIIIKIIKAIGEKAEDIVTAGREALESFLRGLVGNALKVTDSTFELITQFLNGMAETIDKRAPEIRSAGWNLARAIIDGLTGGLASMAGEVIEKFKQMAKDGLGAIGQVFNINSPSKATYAMGVSVAEGLSMALDKDTKVATSAENFANNAFSMMVGAFDNTIDLSQLISESSPTITPVLDISNVEKGMQDINKLVDVPTIDTSVSLDQAASLAVATKPQDTKTEEGSTKTSEPTKKEIKFEQNIHSPKALSLSDIYRQTRSQIAFAEEKLEEFIDEPN